MRLGFRKTRAKPEVSCSGPGGRPPGKKSQAGAAGIYAGCRIRGERRIVWASVLLLLALAAAGFGCGGISPQTGSADKPDADFAGADFEIEKQEKSGRFATPQAVETFSADGRREDYVIGTGDVLSVSVWGRQELADSRIVVGPDGKITLPRIGFMQAAGRTRAEVADEITRRLRKYYTHPEVTLEVQDYKNNKAFVLGRVKNPGVVEFPGEGTLLEALSLAGGYSEVAKDTYLTRCAIIRGNDTIIWIDLNELLRNGNMRLNARIRNNDLIYIPESRTEMVYVMGEVREPGAYQLTGRLTVMDALMMAGGPARGGDKEEIYLVRAGEDGRGRVMPVPLSEMIETGNFARNFVMEDDDILYVAATGMTRFNYAVNDYMPFLKVLKLGTDVLENFGIMPKFREEVWDQEGFVDH